MNWKHLLGDIKCIFKRLDRIALINTLKAKVKIQGNGFIYLNQNTSLQLAPSGVLRIENQAYFCFNEYWHQRDYFPGMLGVHGGAVMRIMGNFKIYSGA